MNERTETAHSVNCYFCGNLADERECLPADKLNGNDGGEICPACWHTLTTPKTHVIYSDESCLFWSNDSGWVSLGSATLFTDSEAHSLNLPMGEKCQWVRLDQIAEIVEQ